MQKHFIEYRIENTNMCGYRCVMCPREKQTRKLGFMSVEDFKLVLSKLPINHEAGIHLHGYGEPLLDPTLPEKLAILKAYPYLNSMIISTLGVELPDSYFESLLKHGLQGIIVSFYGFTEETYKATHRVNKLELVKKNLRTIARIRDELKARFRLSIKIQGPEFKQSLIQIGQKSQEEEAKKEFFREFLSLGFNIQEVKSWHNYGNGREYNEKNDRICPVLNGRRGQILNITWDLNVVPCCFDFNSTIKFGNLKQMSIEEIFTSDAFEKFLLAQIRKDYKNYPVCQGCEKIDY